MVPNDAVSPQPEGPGRGALPVAGVAALMVVAAAARLLALDRHSFWYDEAVSVELARASLGDLLSGRVKDLGNPPLYPVLLHLWMAVFGAGDAAIRALSAVLGAATVPLVFVLARRLLTPGAAVLATLLFAFAPFHLQMAQEARTYTLLTLTGVLSVLALLRALDQPRVWGRWALHGLATGAMLLSHYFAFFLVAAQVLYVLAVHRRDRGVLARATAGFALGGLCFAFWLPAFFGQLGVQGNLARSAESWHLHLVATPLVFGVGSTLVWKDSATLPRLALAGVTVLAYAAIVVAGMWALRRSRNGLLLGLWLALPIALPALVSAVASPLYNTRYVILASVPFYLLAGAGLAALPRRLGVGAAGAVGLAIVVAQGSYLTRPVKHDWRSAARFIEERQQAQDVLLFDTDFNETAYARYARRPGVRLRLLDPPQDGTGLWGVAQAGAAAEDLSARIRAGKRAWLVLSDAGKSAIERDRGFFAQGGWRETERISLRGIEVIAFER